MSDWNEAIEAAAAALENECADNPHLENFYLPTPLKYAADLVRSLKRPADQDGWKLVPVQPTEAMYQAALQSGFEGSFDNFSADFKSACESAPTPEAK